jgi:cell division protein FtsI (penicillin-binding protein 3)
VFVALAARAAHLSLIDPRGAARGEAQSWTELTLPPERGLVLDRHGAELAITVQAPSLYAVPGEVPDPPGHARALAKVLGVDGKRLSAQLGRDKRFVYLARWLSEEQAEKVRALNLPGVGLLFEPRRVYPHRELAAHLIGFANLDGEGVRGIEEREDAFLRGRTRTFPVERDARGRVLAGFAPPPDATSGGDVALALDAALQADAEMALDAAIAETGSKAGWVVTLDARSGDVLALAERPTFDPNGFRKLSFPQTRSRAFLDAFEPGSTFKTFLIAAALEGGAVTPSDRFDCENGRFQVPGKLIRDSHPHGVLDVTSVLRVSSNICAAKIGYRLGAQPYYQTLRRFGFGRPTGSGFPHESSGLLRSYKNWRPVDHANIAFGQGVSVTPVQLAAATAVIANGGVWTQPRLVTRRRAPGGTWRDEPRARMERVLRTETAETMLSMMEGVVSTPEGTGKRAAIPGVRVGGKTGTAQKIDPATGRYATSRYIAWFTGIAPIDDPRLVIVVALDEPRGVFHTGGMVAAPVFAKVGAAQLARLGVTGGQPLPPAVVASSTPPVSSAAEPAAEGAAAVQAPPVEDAIAAAEETQAVLLRSGDRVLVPDFRGLSVAQVRRLFAGSGVALELEGAMDETGRAVAQDPDPGTIVAERMARVRVRFAPGA